jgi:hypothetical protein
MSVNFRMKMKNPYYFIYIFAYTLVKTRISDAKFASSQIVLFSIIGHLFLVITITQKYLGFTLNKFYNHKYELLVPGIILVLLFQYYFTKKYAEAILTKYNSFRITAHSVVSFFIIAILPYFISIFLKIHK